MNIDDLPLEILSEIFSRLTFDELIVIKDVSQRWNTVICSPAVWQNITVVYDSDKTDYLDLIANVSEHANLIKNVTVRGLESENNINLLLVYCRMISKLQLVMCKIDESVVCTVNSLINISVLHIKNCYLLNRTGMSIYWDIDFSFLINLKSLLLSDFGLSNQNFDSLLTCKKLIHLDIRKIKSITQDNIIKLLEHTKDQLITLGLYGGQNYNDHLMEYISECSKLRSLSILRCENLTDKGLIKLNKINPTKLELWNNNNFTEKCLHEVFSNDKWSNLEHLSFSKVLHVTGETLKLLAANCKKLHFLGLYRCPELSTDDLNLNELFPSTMIFYERR